MKIYIAYAYGGEYEDKWNTKISIRFNKEQADKDALDYKNLVLSNNRILESKYAQLQEISLSNVEDGVYDDVLESEMCDIASSIFSDFYGVQVCEYEADKLLYEPDTFEGVK